MSFPSSNNWSYDGASFTFPPWNYNPSHDETNSQSQQPPPNPPSYYHPPPQHSSSSSPYPRLPPPNYTQQRHHSTASHFRQQQHSTPAASLHAALREGTDFLSRPSILPRLPPLSRINSTPTQHSSLGYIPNHFFYSPPQSPQEPDPPNHTASTQPTPDSAPSSSIHPFAGPSFTNHFANPSIPNPVAQLSTTSHSTPRFDTESLAGAFRSGQSHVQTYMKEEDPDTMPPSTSASTATTSRKRPRPSSSNTSPSAAKRRQKFAPIELGSTDDDEVEELGPDSDILAKEREALVARQREESSKANRIGDLNCMICLEHFTNMTATHCGHIFCHECLTQALIASQRNSDHNYGTCPACRKPIKPKGKNQIVPLTLMKGRKK